MQTHSPDRDSEPSSRKMRGTKRKPDDGTSMPGPAKRKSRNEKSILEDNVEEYAIDESDEESMLEAVEEFETKTVEELEAEAEEAMEADGTYEETDENVDADEHVVQSRGVSSKESTSQLMKCHSYDNFVYLDLGEDSKQHPIDKQSMQRFADEVRFGIEMRVSEARDIIKEGKSWKETTLGRIVAHKFAGNDVDTIQGKLIPYMVPEAQQSLSVPGWGWTEFCSIPRPPESALKNKKFLYLKLYRYEDGSIQPYTGIAYSMHGGGYRMHTYEKVMEKRAKGLPLNKTQMKEAHIMEMHEAEQVAVRVIAIFPSQYANTDLALNEGIITDWSQSMAANATHSGRFDTELRPFWGVEMIKMYRAASKPGVQRKLSSAGHNRAHPYSQLDICTRGSHRKTAAMVYKEQGSKCACCLQDRWTETAFRTQSLRVNYRHLSRGSRKDGGEKGKQKWMPYLETLPDGCVLCQYCYESLRVLEEKKQGKKFDRIAFEKEFISEMQAKFKADRRRGAKFSDKGSTKATVWAEHGNRTMCCGRTFSGKLPKEINANLKLNTGGSKGTYAIPGLIVKESGLAYTCIRCQRYFARAVADGKIADVTDPVEGAAWLRSQWHDDDIENCPY